MVDFNLLISFVLMRKRRAEHDRNSMHNELNNTRAACDQIAREKVMLYIDHRLRMTPTRRHTYVEC